MKLASKVALVSALLLPMAAAPASAQSWKWDLSLGGGYSWFNNQLDEEDAPALGADEDIGFGSAPFLGAQLTFWPSTRFGIRANATYADTDFGEEVTGIDNVNLWSGTGDLLFRLRQPAEEFTRMEMLPYFALGLGAKWVNPAGAGATCTDVEEGEDFECAPFAVGADRFAIAETSTLMGLVGLGADWRFSRNIALRTEIGDRIWDAPIHALDLATNNTTDEDVGGAVHELYGQLGLTFLFGVERPPVVAVAPPPAPAPTPVPEVRREAINVCVVDPTAPGGIRMQAATLIEGRDTVITVGGTDRPLRESVGNVMVASNADWYVRGQPLSMRVGNQNIEFATYGSARVIDAADLAFLGTVNGMPVYADRAEVQDVIEELDELNAAHRGTDLGKILEEHKDLREDLNDVKIVYVPLYATGCVFQGVQRQEEVRKGGK
ncbi:MAG TPA: hypothetical protein VGD27_12210 [Longimicrobiales bacterium]